MNEMNLKEDKEFGKEIEANTGLDNVKVFANADIPEEIKDKICHIINKVESERSKSKESDKADECDCHCCCCGEGDGTEECRQEEDFEMPDPDEVLEMKANEAAAWFNDYLDAIAYAKSCYETYTQYEPFRGKELESLLGTMVRVNRTGITAMITAVNTCKDSVMVTGKPVHTVDLLGDFTTLDGRKLGKKIEPKAYKENKAAAAKKAPAKKSTTAKKTAGKKA